MLQTMKDKALSTGAIIAINQHINEYGSITNLSLNSKFKSIHMDVLLHGEKEPIEVQVENYLFTEDNQLRISGVTTSREWINTLALNHLESKEFSLPSEYAQILKTIV
jgi:hypothetical protein